MKDYFKKSKSFLALALAVLIAFTMTPVQGVQAATVKASATVKATAAITASGIITNSATKKVVSGASVSLMQGTKVVGKAVKTDSKGKYTLTGLKANTSYTIKVAATGYAPYTFVAFKTTKSVTKSKAIVPVFAVSGTIKGTKDALLKDASVTLYQGTKKIGSVVKTDAKGNYKLANVPYGTGYTVKVEKSGYTTKTFVKFDVKKNVTGKSVTLKATTPVVKEFKVTGKITEKDATPEVVIAGATVKLMKGTEVAGTATTTATGTYEIAKVTEGSYTLEVSADGYTTSTPTTVEVTTADKTQDVALVKVATPATAEAAKITATALGTITVGDTDSVLAKAQKLVSADYTVTVKSSSDEAKISKAGIALVAGTSDVVFTVTNKTTATDTADTAAVALTVVAATSAEISSVTAINANQLELKFTKEVDEKTAETLTNYTVKKADGTSLISAATANAVLQADGKTVVLTLNQTYGASMNQLTLAVTAKNIKMKGTDALFPEYTNAAVSLFDTVVPTVTEVKQISPKEFDIYFSEPVTSASASALASAIKINSGAYAVTAQTAIDDNNIEANVVRISTTSALPNGTYSLELNGTLTPAGNEIKDFAGFKLNTVKQDLVTKGDTTLPTAQVTKVEGNAATIKFDKKVANLVGNTNVKVRLDYNNDSIEISGANVTNPTSDGQTFVATFLTAIPVGAHSLYIHYAKTDASVEVVKDVFGNIFENDSKLDFSVTADTTAPTVLKAEYNTTTKKIEVAFSESVVGVTADAVELKDAAGTKVTVTVAQKANTSYTYEFTPTSTIEGGCTFKILADKITDASLAKNKLPEQSFSLTIKDSTPPVPLNVTTGSGKVFVYYNEVMATTGAGSVLDKANYQINGAALGTNDTITIGSNGKYVVIATATTVTALTVGRVADMAGNFTTAFSQTFSGLAADGTVAVLLGGKSSSPATLPITVLPDGIGLKVIAKNQVQFYLDKQVSGADASKIKLGTNITATAVSYTNTTETASDGTTTLPIAKVTVTFPTGTFGANGATAAGDEDLVFSEGAFSTLNGTLTSAVATAVDESANPFQDAIAPSIAVVGATTVKDVKTADTDFDGEVDSVVIKFDEPVAATSKSDFTVDGFIVTAAAVGENENTHVVTLTVTPNVGTPAGTTGKTPLVTVKSITDAVSPSIGNGLLANTATGLTATAMDYAQPVMMSLKIEGTAGSEAIYFGGAIGDKITMTFSENIKLTSASDSKKNPDGTYTLTATDIKGLTNAAAFSALAEGTYIETVSDNKITVITTVAGTATSDLDSLTGPGQLGAEGAALIVENKTTSPLTTKSGVPFTITVAAR